MSSQFTVNVQNKTGATITSVCVAHYCNDNTNAGTFPSIANGQSQSIGTVTTYALHKDYYGGMFVRGGDFYQFNCYCSSESGDTSVSLILGPDSYTVQYYAGGTASDSCSDKSYDYSTS